METLTLTLASLATVFAPLATALSALIATPAMRAIFGTIFKRPAESTAQLDITELAPLQTNACFALLRWQIAIRNLIISQFSSCSTSSVCTSCHNNFFLNPLTSQCVTTCPSGYFANIQSKAC